MEPDSTEKNAQETQAKPQARPRRRARKACLSCRSRKVRCDVSQRGRPCMNCYLDSETCIVTGRASKFHGVLLDPRDGIQASHPPYAPLDQQSFDDNDDRDALHSTSNDQHASCTPQNPTQRPVEVPNNVAARDSTRMESAAPDPVGERLRDLLSLPGERATSSITTSQDSVQSDTLAFLSCLSNYVDPEPTAKAYAGPSSEVVYCFYPFLAVSNLHNVPHQDVNFLELQGCLRVPVRPFLDDLIQQYFFHVHPILPLVNEGDFWELYCHDADTSPTRRLSLLVFQAMLFASCTFVSHSTMEGLGYSTIRAMRASFYRRTKLLYDMGAESSGLHISQAAVLLSLYTLSSAKKPNTAWLSLAIDSARSVEAHLYASMPSSQITQQQALLRRLWWCCIIRDRSMGLLMRIPIQIRKDQFDFTASPLGVADLSDEFERSKVYNSETKRALAEIVAQWTQFNIVLTDILTLCFPLRGRHHQELNSNNSTLLGKCKRSLKEWYDQATLRLSVIPGASGPRILLDEEISHDSITLYSNLLLMYYHSSRAALCHHAVLYLDTLQGGGRTRNDSLTNDLSIILDNQHELQDAATSITECHKQLVRLNLARWLPAPAIGCTLLPLVLNILDIKLAAPAVNFETTSRKTPALRQRELNTLIEVMKTYQLQYDGVDWASEIVRHIINLAQLDNLTPQIQRSRIDWTHIFAFQPSSYLRLALALDLSLSKGRLAQDGDFPISLRGLFAVDFSPIKEIFQPQSTSFYTSNSQMFADTRRDIGVIPLVDLALESVNRRARLPFDTDQTSRAVHEIPQHHNFMNWTSIGLEDTGMSLSDELGDLGTGTDEMFLPQRESRCETDKPGDKEMEEGSSDNPTKCISTTSQREIINEVETIPGTTMGLMEAIRDGNIGECIS